MKSKTKTIRTTIATLGFGLVGALAVVGCKPETPAETAADLRESVHEMKTEEAAETREEIQEFRQAAVLDSRHARLFALEERLDAVRDRAEDIEMAPVDERVFESVAEQTEPVLESLHQTDDDFHARASAAERNIERLESMVQKAG